MWPTKKHSSLQSSFKFGLSLRDPHSGFTLVEMLVSVGLVLLMMSLFSATFVQTTEILSKQRGLAENDQRSRMLTTVVKSDLDARTFRDVLPFRAGEDTAATTYPVSRRSGYFEIYEGSPRDDTDDVLQFTASVNYPTSANSPIGYIGKSLGLSGVAISGTPSSQIQLPLTYASLVQTGSFVWIYGTSGTAGVSNDGRYSVTGMTTSASQVTLTLSSTSNSTWNAGLSGYLLVAENDPEFDDGVAGNGVTNSAYAEVSYFLRGTSLYRRVLLIRDNQSNGNAQPLWNTGVNILWTNNFNGGATSFNNQSNIYPWDSTTSPTGLDAPTSFWRDFDYSAFYYPGKTSNGGGSYQGSGVYFNSSTNSLDNSIDGQILTYDDTTSPAITHAVGLVNPANRFGHNPVSGATYAYPQQLYSPAGVGRFTLMECSHSAFGYPGYIPAGGNPLTRTNLTVDPITGFVQQYWYAPPIAATNRNYRRGEDLLLANVLSFDVKVYDPVSGIFADVGDGAINTTGCFNPSNAQVTDAFGNVVGGQLNASYPTTAGPDGPFVFDTWHPAVKLGTNTTLSEPPFVPAANNRPVPLSAIQITINYRDRSSNQVRQLTLVQSLTDRSLPSGQ